jgi:4-hydroxybenzoate polyprenyltransferase
VAEAVALPAPRFLRGLLLGCHPLPVLAVTAFAAAYALVQQTTTGQDIDVADLVAVALAILTGQLCVGWSNDALDAERDLTAHRQDKPISAGLISADQVAAAAMIAAAACVLLSWRLGDRAAGIHLIAVASALSYNAGLKGTVLSPLPYVLSFGLLPVIASVAVTNRVPPAAHIAAAALLGAAAHFGNTVGDSEADALTGVRGLPQQVGPQRSLVTVAAVVAVAATVLVADVLAADGTAVGRRVVAIVLLLTGVITALVVAVRGIGVPGGSTAWRLTLFAVALVITGFLIGA